MKNDEKLQRKYHEPNCPEERIRMAIHECEDRYVEEAIVEMDKQSRRGSKGLFFSMIRVAAAVVLCVLLIGTGVAAAAGISDSFHNWLLATFTDYEVSRISSPKQEAGKEKADIEADSDKLLALQEDVQIIRGDQESFICEVHSGEEENRVDKVYKVLGNGLKELEIFRFEGDYDGTSYAFEYAVIANEILGFNTSGSISQVYPVLDGDEAYVELWQVDEDTVIKGCIAKIHLKTGAMEKITDDNMICNTIMAPGGKRILCNHRSDGYWTALDLERKKETRLNGVNGYAHIDEISFIDEDHIFAMTEEEYEYTADGENYSGYICGVTDLNTGKVVKKIKDNVGDFNPEWNYKLHGSSVEIYNIVTKQSFTPAHISADNFHGVSAIGNYVLLWKSDPDTDDYYLVYIWNMSDGKGMDVEVPEQIRGEVEIYLAASEKKILALDEKEAYFIDISGL